jgi:hypothetical protein
LRNSPIQSACLQFRNWRNSMGSINDSGMQGNV